MRVHHLRVLAIGVVVGAVATWAPWDAAMRAADAADNPCGADASPVAGKFMDVNDDGLADLIVGAPDARVDGVSRAGVVEVLLGKQGRAPFDGERVVIHLSHPRAGDHFGASIATGDVDGDCQIDAVVGVPGLDLPAADNAGGVVVLAHGDDFRSTKLEPLDRTALLGLPQTDEEFGAALDIRPEPLGTARPILVGAPGATVDSARGAGRVVEFTYDSTTGMPKPGSGTTYDQSRDDVPGQARPRARFGAAIRASQQSFLVVGAPGYPVAGHAGAGAVAFLHVPTTGSADTSCLRTKNDPHVPGRVRRGDHLGAALGPPGVVGAPGEDVDGAAGAGAVYLFAQFCGLQQPGNRAAYRSTQNHRGVAGHAEPGDHFGAALDPVDRYIGVPGEDVDGHRDAGVVQNWYGGHIWRPGVEGFHGQPTTGARFGATLLHAPTDQIRWKHCSDFYCEKQTSTILVGAPGDDRGRGSVFVSRKYVVRPASGTSAGAGFGASASSSGSSM